jgi:hypothetical protein
MHRVQTDVVASGPVPADLESLGRLGLGRRLGEVDLHPPEVAHELVPAVFEETPPVLVHDVDVQSLQPALARPQLGEVEQLRAEPLPPGVGVDA